MNKDEQYLCTSWIQTFPDSSSAILHWWHHLQLHSLQNIRWNSYCNKLCNCLCNCFAFYVPLFTVLPFSHSTDFCFHCQLCSFTVSAHICTSWYFVCSSGKTYHLSLECFLRSPRKRGLVGRRMSELLCLTCGRARMGVKMKISQLLVNHYEPC